MGRFEVEQRTYTILAIVLEGRCVDLYHTGPYCFCFMQAGYHDLLRLSGLTTLLVLAAAP